MKVLLPRTPLPPYHHRRNKSTIYVISTLLLRLRQLVLSAFIAFVVTSDAIPIQSHTKIFGHSIKNGPLPANEEVTAFEHHCQTPPCAITLIHVPSIYPPNNEPLNWTHGIINFYIDHKNATDSGSGGGDDTAQSNLQATTHSERRAKRIPTTKPQPNISISLLELAGESKFNRPHDNPTMDGTPWGIDMMGRTSITGGVYSTVRIPFQSSIRITIQAPSSAKGQSVYWMIVRGLEGYGGITLGNGEFELPPTSKLRVIRIPSTKLGNHEFITLATLPPASGGALLRVTLDTDGPSFHYLEGCLRLITSIMNENENRDDISKLIYLSSGMEDYFLGASYFDAGMFKTPNSGLTYLDRDSHALGAYKTHTYDPIIFQNGMKLIFRNNEITDDCGTIDCCPRYFQSHDVGSSSTITTTTSATEGEGETSSSTNDRDKGQGNPMKKKFNSEDAQQVTYAGLVWLYEWDTLDLSSHERQNKDNVAAQISMVADLSSSGFLSNEEEDATIDRLLETDSKLSLLLKGLAATHQKEQLARQIRRYLRKVARAYHG